MNNEDIGAFPVDEDKSGLRTTEQIRVLVCHVLSQTDRPVSRKNLIDALFFDGIANYFEISQAVDSLVEVGALSVQDGEEQMFTVTERGRKIADSLENDLSVYIKNKAVAATLRTLLREKRTKENDVTVTRAPDGGAFLNIGVHSGIGEDDLLMSLSVYAPSHAQAEAMRVCFINDPLRLYDAVVEALTSQTELQE